VSLAAAEKPVPPQDDLYDYFDSAPVPHLGEPAPVSTLPDPKQTNTHDK
jgi:hypothetical protein